MKESAQEENLPRIGKIKKRLTEIWSLLEPYRLGFGLGALAVSATLIIVLTGQKSEKLNYSAKPYNSQPIQEAISVPKESGNSGSPVLGAQDMATKEATPVSTTKSSSKPTQSGKININSASVSTLETLPGIGPTIAKAIVDYRNIHGPFKYINDLDSVKRIGLKTIEKFRNLVTVE